MRHYYSTVDSVALTHSEMTVTDNQRVVYTRFERPNENGFDFAEGTLPFTSFSKTYGFQRTNFSSWLTTFCIIPF